MDSVWYAIYSVFIAIWTTLFVESWKQKEAFLGNRWLVRNYDEVSFDRKEFKYSLNFEGQLRSSWKVAHPSKRGKFASWVISTLSMGLVIAVFCSIQVWNQSIDKGQVETIEVIDAAGNVTEEEKRISTGFFKTMAAQFSPSVVCTVAIIVGDQVYRRIAERLVNGENHRNNHNHESSLSSLSFRFKFWNSYALLFIYAFWEHDAALLAQQLLTI